MRKWRLAADAADWARGGVTRQLDVIVGHIRSHDELLESLPEDQRSLINDAGSVGPDR